MALIHHLMRRSHGLRLAATNTISLTIGNFYDASLNARNSAGTYTHQPPTETIS
jgi:hypothetical protein